MNKFERISKLNQKISSLHLKNESPQIEENEFRIQELEKNLIEMQRLEEQNFTAIQEEISQVKNLIEQSK